MDSMVDIAALQCVRRVFGAARCLAEGGSLTLFATLLSGTGFDEVVAEDLLDAANGVIRMDWSWRPQSVIPPLTCEPAEPLPSENFLNGRGSHGRQKSAH